ncbi:MAG: hypothetical protein ACK4TB_05595 [Gemmobacter sp.]
MTVSIRTLPRHGLVVVRYAGLATVADTLAAAAEAMRDPAYALAPRHLVDVTRITGYERDFPAFFAMQARLADHVPAGRGELIVAYAAPTRAGQEMAQMARKSWEGSGPVIIRVAPDIAGALDMLGLAHAADELGSLTD